MFTHFKVSKKTTIEQIEGVGLRFAKSMKCENGDNIDVKEGNKRYQKISVEQYVAYNIKWDCSLNYIYDTRSRMLYIESDEYGIIPQFCQLASEDAGFSISGEYIEEDEHIEKILNAIEERKQNTALPILIIYSNKNFVNDDPYIVSSKYAGLLHIVFSYKPFEKCVYLFNGYKSEIQLNDDDIIKELLYTQKNTITWVDILNMRPKEVKIIEKIIEQKEEKWEEKFYESERQRLILEARLKTSQIDGLLQRGSETDYYIDEIKETIIKTLKNAIPNTKDRTHDILVDIVKNNPTENHSEELKENIKAIFRADTTMNDRMISSLRKLGCEVTQDGKHYKLKWQNDPRYMTIVSSTPSDKRIQTEEAQTLIRRIT